MSTDRHILDRVLSQAPLLSDIWWRRSAAAKRLYCRILAKCGRLTPSSFVLWVATRACNYSCGFCEASSGCGQSGELTTVEARALLAELPQIGAKRLLISGGEPLLRRDLPELMEYAAGLGVSSGLCSNGWLVEPLWDRLRRVPQFLFMTSIDGPPDYHDRVRGPDGAFKAAMRALQLYTSAGVEQRLVRTVVQPSNLHRLDELRRLISGSGATEWSLTPALPVGLAKDRSEYQLSPAELRALVAFVRGHRHDRSPRIALAHGCSYLQYFSGYQERRPHFCGAGLTRCAVMPNGNVTACAQAYDCGAVEGNVRRTPLAEIWRHGFQRQRRGAKPEQCQGCEHWRTCQGGCEAEREIRGACMKCEWDEGDCGASVVHTPVPAAARKLVSPPRRALMSVRSLRLDVVHFAGNEPGSGGVYIGEGQSLDYLLRRYGAQARQRETASVVALGRTIGEGRRSGPLTVVEVSPVFGRLCPPGGYRSWPWVRHVLDLNGAVYAGRRRGIEHSFGWSVRRHGYHHRITREAAEVERFYHCHYMPHITGRHGELAAIRTISQIARAVKSGFLLQVFDGEDWISGLAVSRQSGERVQLVACGLHPSRRERWRDGSLSAVYYFLIGWAKQAGVRYVDFGGTRPHLMDGAFRHKTLWGAEAARDRWNHTELTFYADAAEPLPPAAGEQLVWQDGGFVTLEAARSSASGGLDAGPGRDQLLAICRKT